MRSVTCAIAKCFAFLIVTQASADMSQITTFRSDSRLMAHVVSMEVWKTAWWLKNGNGTTRPKHLTHGTGPKAAFPPEVSLPKM